MGINVKVQVNYWRTNSAAKWKTAQGLYTLRRNADCLFFCHLTLECLLKGLVVTHTKTYAPKIHNLAYLASKTSLIVSPERQEQLNMITTFNVAGRYPDVKFEFYKSITRNYTDHWLTITRTLRVWLLKGYRTIK